MNNYRVIFSLKNLDVDYWNKGKLQAESYCNFKELPDLYKECIKDIYSKSKELGVIYFWFFFEPHLEITWLSDDISNSEKLIYYIDNKYNNLITDFNISRPKDGLFGDWFCKNELEREFGAKRHDVCRQLVFLFWEYEKNIKDGKGAKEQVKRTIHTLCNPLGLNYLDEAYICFSRGLICLLFRFFSFKKAVWIYTKIFRQKY